MSFLTIKHKKKYQTWTQASHAITNKLSKTDRKTDRKSEKNICQYKYGGYENKKNDRASDNEGFGYISLG